MCSCCRSGLVARPLASVGVFCLRSEKGSHAGFRYARGHWCARGVCAGLGRELSPGVRALGPPYAHALSAGDRENTSAGNAGAHEGTVSWGGGQGGGEVRLLIRAPEKATRSMSFCCWKRDLHTPVLGEPPSRCLGRGVAWEGQPGRRDATVLVRLSCATGRRAGMSSPRPRMAWKATQHKCVHVLKIRRDFFATFIFSSSSAVVSIGMFHAWLREATRLDTADAEGRILPVRAQANA